MKINSPLPGKKARLEIIPLIDIMFFLLAAFMMASLTLVRLQSIKMDLPTATAAHRDFKPDIIHLAVDRKGDVFIERRAVSTGELNAYLAHQFQLNPNAPVYISGDKDARHGSMIRVLDLVRRAGLQKVAFAVAPPSAEP